MTRLTLRAFTKTILCPIMLLGVCLLVMSDAAEGACNTYNSQFDDYHHHDGSSGNDHCEGNADASYPHPEDFFIGLTMVIAM